MGTIGTVRAVFEADTSAFDAANKSASASLGEVGQQATAAGQKVDAATRLQEAATRRFQRVLQQVAAEQKALAGQNVTDGARKVAEATLEQSKAYAELHRVQGLVRSDAVDAAAKADLLARSQAHVAETSATLAQAKQREAAAVELAGVKEALAGQRVTEEALRTTAALRAQAEAQSLLNRAQALAAGGLVAGPEGVQLIAAAQLKQVSAAAEVAAAKKAEAIAVAQAAEEEALSQNVIVRAFQRVALAARESLNSVKERMALFVEDGALEAGSMSRITSGLGSLLGAGIAVGFAANFADEIAKANVELDHMSEKTGVEIEALAGLRQEFRQLGADPDSSNRPLFKMDNAFEKAKTGDKGALAAFGNLGIKPEELRNIENSTQLLARLSKGLAETEEQEKRTSSATAIFGKGGADMIPVLIALGGNFTKATAELAKMTGVTKEGIEASKAWIANSAKMHAVMERLGNFAIENFHYVAAVLDGIGTILQAVFEGAATIIVGVSKEVVALGRTMYDAMHFNIGDLPADAERVKTAFVDVWKAGFKDISHNWDESIKLLKPAKVPALENPTPFGKSDDEDFVPKGAKAGDAARKAAEAQMEAFEHGASVIEEAGNADAFTIHGYWAKKIEAMQQGSAEWDKVAGNLNYNRIFAKLADATKRMDAELEKSLHPKKDEGAAAFAREQEHAADEQARRVTEIRQRAADEQAKLQERAQLSDVSIALSHGEISRYQALVAEAQIHAAAFGAEIADVERRLAEAQALHDLPGMDEEIAKRQAQLAQLRAQAAEQAQQDASAVSSATMGGAFHDALNEWVQQSQDAADLVRKAFVESANGINDALSKALTDPARSGEERMRNLRNALAGTFRGIANQGITFALGKLETGLLGSLGIGPKKKPTGSKGDPLYVAWDAAVHAGGKAASAATAGINAGLGKIGIATDSGSIVGKIEHALGLGGGGGSSAPTGSPSDPLSVQEVNPSAGGNLFSGLPKILGGDQPDAGGGGTDSVLGGIANIGLSLLGGGSSSGGKPDGSASNPFNVKNVSGGGGGIGSLLGGLGGGLFGGGGGDAAAGGDAAGGLDFLSGLIPGFATGGPIAPDMGAFIVGERGPEILNIGSAAGRVTPNSQLKSFGGDSHHHEHNYNIDARGAGDPAATEQAIHRAMRNYLPAAVTASVAAVSDQKRRMPSTRR